MPDCRCLAHNGFLTRRGYKVVRAIGLDKAEEFGYLDKVCSVSALVEVEVSDAFLDEQHQRFLNGS